MLCLSTSQTPHCQPISQNWSNSSNIFCHGDRIKAEPLRLAQSWSCHLETNMCAWISTDCIPKENYCGSFFQLKIMYVSFLPLHVLLTLCEGARSLTWTNIKCIAIFVFFSSSHRQLRAPGCSLLLAKQNIGSTVVPTKTKSMGILKGKLPTQTKSNLLAFASSWSLHVY